MADLPTRLDLYERGRLYVRTHAKKIDPASVDVDGSDANVFVGLVSWIGDVITRQLAEQINAHLLDGADGDDLTRHVLDVYRLVPKGAAPAIGNVVFSRATAANGAGKIDTGTKLLTLAGVEYITTTPAFFTATSTTATASVRAVSAGKSYQVGANAIRKFARTPFDPTISVTNPATTAGGEEAESPDVFREAARDYWAAARRGTISAIEFGATRVAGVSSALAVEVTSNGAPAKLVELFIADSSGVSSTELATKVQTELGNWRAGGIQVIIQGSIPQIVQVSLALSFSAGVDNAAVTQQVLTAILEYINSLGVGQPLLRNDLGAVLARFRSAGLIPTEGSIVVPTGDLYPDSGKTLRTRAEFVTTL